jgi:hypothetical protein
MIRAYAIFAACVIACIVLAGCASDKPGEIKLQTVNVPVPVHCTPKIETIVIYPDSTDALRTAANIFERTKLLLAGRDIRTARIQELEAALKGCE